MRNDYFLYGFYIVLWDENVYYYMGCNFIYIKFNIYVFSIVCLFVVKCFSDLCIINRRV